LGCSGCGEESWRIGIVLGVELEFWVVECGECIAKRDISPCGIIASAQGWLVVERK
jgi:hypothetical protein